MFKVKKFDVCPLTGYVDWEIKFSMFGSPARTSKGTYTNEKEATRKLDEMKRDYLLFTIENLVQECKKIYETGSRQNSSSRTAALYKCIDGLHYLQDKQLTSIAGTILNMEPVLQYVLPTETNERYNFLYSQKVRLINFSKEVTNSQKPELCQA